MQTKILAAAVAALSYGKVEAAILPRVTITPGNVVLPQLTFGLDELGLIHAALTGCQITNNDLLKTINLINDLNRPSAAGAETLLEVRLFIKYVTASGILTFFFNRLSTKPWALQHNPRPTP